MKKPLYISIFAILALGCVKEIPLKTKETAEALPVLHMFIKAGSPVLANFQRVTAISAPAFYANTAIIAVSGPSFVPFGLGGTGNGNYTSSTNLNARDSFTITVKDNTDSFAIKGVVPNNIKLNSVDTLISLVGGIGPAFTFKLVFADSAQYDNYYRIYVYKQGWRYKSNGASIYDSTAFEEPISLGCNDIAVVQNSYNNYTNRELLFSDQTFNGIEKEILIYSREEVKRNSSEKWTKTVVHIENISKPLYDFYNTRNAHIWQQKSITQIPGLIKVNIPGGYGICGAYTEDYKIIILR